MVKQSTLRKILGQGNRTREQAACKKDIVTKERFYSNEQKRELAAYQEDRVTQELFYSNKQISGQAACREDIVTEERVMAYITNNLSTC